MRSGWASRGGGDEEEALRSRAVGMSSWRERRCGLVLEIGKGKTKGQGEGTVTARGHGVLRRRG